MINIRTPEWTRAIEAANNADLVEYCQMTGIEVVRHGSEWRHREHDSLKMRDNKWKRWSQRTGKLGKYVQGTTITFVMEYEGLRFLDAVERILRVSGQGFLLPGRTRGENIAPAPPVPIQQIIRDATGRPEEAPDGKRESRARRPEKSTNNERVFLYLTKQRGLDEELVREQFRKGTLYESSDFHNCVFVGINDAGETAYAFERGTGGKRFAGDTAGSNKAWSWSCEPAGPGSVLKVYESPIDALSHMTLDKRAGEEGWAAAHYLSLGGTDDKALDAYLQRHRHIREIIFCLDNDEAGHTAMEQFMKKYSTTCRCVMRPPVGFKDWNDVLTGKKETETKEEPRPEEPAGQQQESME